MRRGSAAFHHHALIRLHLTKTGHPVAQGNREEEQRFPILPESAESLRGAGPRYRSISIKIPPVIQAG